MEGTVRQEKTATLYPGSNTFVYPSVNGSVIYSSLLKDNKPEWLDYGKIRLSYGVVGNAPEIYKAATGYNQSAVGSYISVSYTHLDVYKRQIFFSASITQLSISSVNSSR